MAKVIELAIGIFSSIVGIIASLLGLSDKGKGTRKAPKLKKGNAIPSLTPYATHHTESCVRVIDGYKVEFDFTPEVCAENPPEYISAACVYPHPFDIKKYKKLNFEIRFLDGDFDKLWLELHSLENNKIDIWHKEISYSKEWKPYSINLKIIELTDIIQWLKEISFVVNIAFISTEAIKSKKAKGSFEIKGIDFV